MTIAFETINNINDLKKGDIVFFEGKGLISWLIRGSQKKDAEDNKILDDNNPEHLKYTHVAIYIGDGVMYHADFDFWPINRIFSSGVSFEALDIYCKKSKSCLILRNDYIDKSIEHFDLFGLIKEFQGIRKTYNRRYALLSIIRFLYIIERKLTYMFKKNSIKNNKVLDKKRYYCSQLILNILINYDILEHSESNITPFELIHILFEQKQVNANFIYTLSKEAETKEYKDFVKRSKLYAEIAVIHYNTLDDRNTLGDTKKLNKIIEKINTKFNEIISFYGDNAEVYNNWGSALCKLKQYEEAIGKFEKAIKLNPNYAEAYNNWGSALGTLGENRGAIEKYEKAIECNPKFAEAYNNWGIVLCKLKQYEEAIEKFEKALFLATKKNFDEDKIQGIERNIEIAKQELTKMLIIN